MRPHISALLVCGCMVPHDAPRKPTLGASAKTCGGLVGPLIPAVLDWPASVRRVQAVSPFARRWGERQQTLAGTLARPRGPRGRPHHRYKHCYDLVVPWDAWQPLECVCSDQHLRLQSL